MQAVEQGEAAAGNDDQQQHTNDTPTVIEVTDATTNDAAVEEQQ